MRVQLKYCSLNFDPVPSPYMSDPQVNWEWMRHAWQLTFEMPQDQVPLHQPQEDEPWHWGGNHVWRTGPVRMNPLMCLNELLFWLQGHGFGMLAGHLQDEIMNAGLGVAAGADGEPDRFIQETSPCKP